jgi:DNA-binding transcriptional LysR family regulator
MDITLKQLRAFVAVVDTGSFSEAAKGLHLSQAALSGLIRELERRVGARLFDRTTRRVAATPMGRAFEPMARRVLAGIDDAIESLSSLKDLRRGLVRIAAPEPLSCTFLPKLIAAYRSRHPDVELRFDDIPMPQVLDHVHNGLVDIGVGPSPAVPDAAVTAHALEPDLIGVALRPDDDLAGQPAVTWKQLRQRPLINFMPNLGVNVLSRVPPRHHPVEVRAVNRINTALALLGVQDGAVICPSMARSLVAGFGLVFLPLAQPRVRWPVAMLTRHNTTLSPAASSLIAVARQMRSLG